MSAARTIAWILRLALVGVAVAIVAVWLAGCTLLGGTDGGRPSTSAPTVTGVSTDAPEVEAIPVEAVSLVEYRVSAPLPTIDTSMRSTVEPARVAALVDLLNERPRPGGYDSPPMTGATCPPGTGSAFVGVTLTSGERLEFSVNGCDGDEWAQRLSDLVWGWVHDEGL